ncbi:unnamed protein product [Schistosoma curassoni]|nr:unnamed protein product [Schistosoma curassoni]
MDWNKKHLNLNESTEFESLITIEPMEVNNIIQDPLNLTFEEYETSQISDSVHVFPSEPRGVLKKKPRFAVPIIIESEVEKEDVTDKVKSFINENELVEQMDNISFEEYSEKVTDLECQEICSITEQNARLDQLTSRIFATILPENVPVEQSKQDVKQAYKRLNMITNGAQVLVFNCSQTNLRLDRIFQKVQNCVFSLTSFPNLATMVVFCQKVYDWLALDEYHIILLHAEGEQAKIRLMLLVLALDSFYGSINKYRNNDTYSLRRYISSHLNGFPHVPVGWMRYAGYMEIFSPTNSLYILRAPLHIYQIYLYNFPVFEKNKLRLYFKFYTGSPPVHMYTTNLYEYERTDSANLVLNFQSNSNRNIGLQLSGDIIILAYHSRSYPLKRIRLFRIHIHSCQGIDDWIRFVPNDFEEISGSFPSSMSLILNLTSKPIPLTADEKIQTKVENVSKQKTAFNSHSDNLLDVQNNPEDRSRLHDSLENLSESIRSRQLPLRLAPCLNKKNHFDYLVADTKLDSTLCTSKLSHIDDSRINNRDALHNDQKMKSCWDPWMKTSISQRINSRAYECLDSGLEGVQEEFDNVTDQEEEIDYIDHNQNNNEIRNPINKNIQSETDSLKSNNTDPNDRRQESESSSSSLSFKKLRPKYLFHIGKSKHKNIESVNDLQIVGTTKPKSEKDCNEQESMPPPPSTTVLKYSKKHKTIATRIVNFFSAHSKHRKMDSNQSINDSSIHSSDSPNNINHLDYDDSSELSLGQQSSSEISTSKRINQKTQACDRGIPTDKLGPPCKTRKLISVGTSTHWTEPVQTFYPTEDLVEAARYLNIMAGTQELDRLLEELRLTSMNMAAGLPPPSNTHYNSKPYYSSQTSRKQLFHDEVYPDHRYAPSSRSASVTGYNTDAHNFNDSLRSNYHKHSTFYSDRIDNIGKSTSKFNSSFSTPPRHQSVFTTTLKQRPPVAPRKFNQIHLTIDPDCGTTDAQSAVSVRLENSHDSFRREKKLENDLQTAREELANLRRAMSLVDERHQRIENINDSRNLISPSHSVPRRSPNMETQQYLSTSSSFQRSYQVQQHSTPGSVNSYQQRTYPRKEPTSIYKSQIISNDGNFSAPKRAMSHTNVYGPRSWNLRSYQGSESDLAYKREMLSSSSSRLARSGYSARRERLKQEREQELLRQTRLRQMAASSTGLHDHRHYQQSNVQQQHYRSTSAVNEIGRKEIIQKRSMGNTEAFEEFETITLQPIGRGVQDLDSHVGSMTTLARGGGASSMIEVHKHTFRTPRMYSPTSYHFNRAHSTTPTRYSRPTKGFSNGLYKSHSAYSGSVETCPMFKSHTPDPGRDITGSPLWTALPRNSSTTPTTCKTWRSERNITTTPLGQITYEDMMPNTQMAKIQVLESSELPTTLSPYSRKSASLQPNEVVKKDIRVFESPSDNAILNNYLDIHESEMTNLKRVVSLRKPPERSRLWALPDSMKILRSSDGFMADSCYPNDVDIDENEELINHQFNLPEPGKTTLKTEINGLSQIDDHQPPRASSRTSLSRQPFASTQYLNKQNYNHDGEQTIFINRVQPTSSTPVQSYPPSRLGTQSVYSDHITVSTTPQTVTAPTKVVSNLNVLTNTRKTSELTEVPMQNGWKSEKPKQDTVDSGNMPQVIATARVWYQPKLSREEAISILRQQVPGSFLIRDSTTYKDAFGLAVKVATLPPKVTPKSNDLQSELVRHYLIEAVNTPTKGVRLKGFASEPVFPSLAALINRHTQDALALPCRLILPAIPTTPLPHGYKPPPQIVTGLPPNTTDTTISNHISQSNNQYISKVDSATGPVSELGSVIMDNVEIDCTKSVTNTSTMGIEGLPFECVIKDEHHKPVMSQSLLNQGMTYRCFMLGSVDTPQWNNELCFSRAVDQLIPLETLTASECDHGISRVRYSDIQLHVSAHDGITIIDLLRRLFLRRHLPNNILLYCGIETRKKEFIHPEHQNHGIRNPKIFGLVVRKGISECTCHIFSECDPVHSAESIVNYIRTIYPHLKS